MRRPILCLLVLWTVLWMPGAARTARAATAPPAAAAPGTGPAFDPEAATEAYLARLSPEQRARSDAYFEGGYWLRLWDFVWTLAVLWLLLGSRLSARLRDAVERWTRFRFLQALLYGLAFIFLLSLLTFPMDVYEDFFREHQYGMATQDFAAWLGDQLKGLAIGLIFGSLFVAVLYAVFRKAPRTWWIWGAAVMVAFLVLGLLIAPVFIAPLFNTYTELEVPELRGSILSLARANGIPADHVYVYDASRQTNQVSANVSGLLNTLRISLNDNLLKRGSPACVRAVMGHEMGHYVLNHAYEMIVELGAVVVLGFVFVRWGFGRMAARRGERWGVRGIDDLAGLPLFMAVLVVFFFLMTPVTNTIVRTNEAEADIFGLNASREPDGFAEAALLVSDYRKLSPGPLEEWVFYDHPSGRNRILMAMRWKAEHLKPESPPAP
ncbi:MAG TPA: M48 family metallopeptidase [Thermoanaerobaculia bacterium]|nr:M48 family metallopeptidase [Thermoanaerobaculia bacterium]